MFSLPGYFRTILIGCVGMMLLFAPAFTAMTAAASSTKQPDLWIRKTYDTAYAGNNIINTTGVNQTRGTYANPFLQGQFIFHVQNDGTAADTFKITAPAAPTGWVTKYYRSPSNTEITAQVIGSGWVTPSLAPGASEMFYLMTRPLPYVGVNTTLTRLITAASVADASKTDVVKTMTLVNTGYQPDIWLRNSAEAAYAGDNVLNFTGVGQTRSQAVPAGTAAVYLFRVQNDGNVVDAFKVTGTAAVSGWTVQYYNSATNANITTQVTGGGWTTASLARGTHVGLYAKVTPANAGVAPHALTLTTVSTHDTTRKDVVKTQTSILTGPAITGFTPTSGLPGTIVTISGANLTGTTAVSFNGKAATTITNVTATSLKATVPTEATTGNISVTTPTGTAQSAASFTVFTSENVETIFNNGNIYAVENNPSNPTTFTIAQPRFIVYLQNYHYFNYGGLPGTISLRHSDGTVYGPWQTTGSLGQGNVPNAYWNCYPNVTIKAGVYTVVDSNNATWSHNSASNNCGFSLIKARSLSAP